MPQDNGLAIVEPFWDCCMAASLTLAQGISDDWDPRFDNDNVATTRAYWQHKTSAGELEDNYRGPDKGRRFRISWWSDYPGTITAYLAGTSTNDTSASGYVQVKMNGTITEYLLDSAGTSSQILTLKSIAGPNHLVICTQYAPNSTIFKGVLFNGKTSRWMDVRDTNSYRKA